MRPPAITRELAGSIARWRGVLVLNYHRIGDGRQSVFDRGLWSATAEGLDEQMRWLKSHFDVISPRDIPYIVKVKRGRHVVVTFDDGYADNHASALPVLRANGVPATFFITTGFIDDQISPWWDEIAWMVRTSTRAQLTIPTSNTTVMLEGDRERAIYAVIQTRYGLTDAADFLDRVGEATGTGRPPSDVLDVKKLWMSWDMVRELRDAKMTIGGHTVRHPMLSKLSKDEQQGEITTCLRRLNEELGASVRTFAYPFGQRHSFNDDTKTCLREAGIQTAFSYYGGIRKLDEWDEFDIPRLAVEQHTTFADFRAMVMFPWIS